MTKKLLSVLLVLLVFHSSYCQGFFRKSEKSIYALYGHHLPTKYKVVNGQNNLIGRKNVFSAEMGLNIDYPLIEKWKIRTGINGHLLFLNEVTMGISGNVPSEVTDPHINLYIRGIEYIESVTVGIPFKLLYNFYLSSSYCLSVSGGPYMGIYFPASDEMAGMQSRLNNGVLVRKYWITRHFKNYKSNNSLGISYPQLEWDFDIEATKKFKKYGAVSLGFKTHIGTKNLEKATFIVWPEYPDYKSEGHFILNRSYIGLFAGFTFGRNN